MKHIFSALLILCAACAPAAAQDEYRVLGRHEEAAGGALTFAWPASGIETRVRATRVTARIEDGGDSILDLAVDGVVTQLPLDPGEREYVLLEAATSEEHVIRLTRRSEVWTGVTTIHAVTSDGEMAATPPRAHRILFVGDSITVGYGAAGADETCSYSAETSPPFESYAALSADAFDADFHIVAISGRGVVRNYDGEDGVHMPALIDAALPDRPDTHWDRARFAPELIVINLGANDFSTSGPGETFAPAYVSLLRALRALYPDAHLIAAFGPEEKRVAIDTISSAVATFNQGQARPASFLYLPIASDGRIYGCDWHPGRDTHRLMARVLAAQIARDLRWDYTFLD